MFSHLFPSKVLFDYVASKTKPRDGIGNLLNDQDTLTASDTEKCEVLNNFFSSVFVNEGDAPPPDFKANFKNELSDIEITDDDVVGVGGTRAYLQILLVCIFYGVILVSEKGKKNFFQKFSFLAVCPQKN